MADARRKAELYAHAAGLTLGGVAWITGFLRALRAEGRIACGCGGAGADRGRRRHAAGAHHGRLRHRALEHGPEKWEPVFRKDHASLEEHGPEKWEPVFRKDHALGKEHGRKSGSRLSEKTMRR